MCGWVCSQTYKTHLEGKSHKKKLASQQQAASTGAKVEGEGEDTAVMKPDLSDRPFYCPLCEIQCTSKDSYEAHIRGSRHTKVPTLYSLDLVSVSMCFFQRF